MAFIEDNWNHKLHPSKLQRTNAGIDGSSIAETLTIRLQECQWKSSLIRQSMGKTRELSDPRLCFTLSHNAAVEVYGRNIFQTVEVYESGKDQAKTQMDIELKFDVFLPLSPDGQQKVIPREWHLLVALMCYSVDSSGLNNKALCVVAGTSIPLKDILAVAKTPPEGFSKISLYDMPAARSIDEGHLTPHFQELFAKRPELKNSTIIKGHLIIKTFGMFFKSVGDGNAIFDHTSIVSKASVDDPLPSKNHMRHMCDTNITNFLSTVRRFNPIHPKTKDYNISFYTHPFINTPTHVHGDPLSVPTFICYNQPPSMPPIDHKDRDLPARHLMVVLSRLIKIALANKFISESDFVSIVDQQTLVKPVALVRKIEKCIDATMSALTLPANAQEYRFDGSHLDITVHPKPKPSSAEGERDEVDSLQADLEKLGVKEEPEKVFPEDEEIETDQILSLGMPAGMLGEAISKKDIHNAWSQSYISTSLLKEVIPMASDCDDVSLMVKQLREAVLLTQQRLNSRVQESFTPFEVKTYRLFHAWACVLSWYEIMITFQYTNDPNHAMPRPIGGSLPGEDPNGMGHAVTVAFDKLSCLDATKRGCDQILSQPKGRRTIFDSEIEIMGAHCAEKHASLSESHPFIAPLWEIGGLLLEGTEWMSCNVKPSSGQYPSDREDNQIRYQHVEPLTVWLASQLSNETTRNLFSMWQYKGFSDWIGTPDEWERFGKQLCVKNPDKNRMFGNYLYCLNGVLSTSSVCQPTGSQWMCSQVVFSAAGKMQHGMHFQSMMLDPRSMVILPVNFMNVETVKSLQHLNSLQWPSVFGRSNQWFTHSNSAQFSNGITEDPYGECVIDNPLNDSFFGPQSLHNDAHDKYFVPVARQNMFEKYHKGDGPIDPTQMPPSRHNAMVPSSHFFQFMASPNMLDGDAYKSLEYLMDNDNQISGYQYRIVRIDPHHHTYLVYLFLNLLQA